MKLEIDFPESIAPDILRKAREKGMEPGHWVLFFVMQKIFEEEKRLKEPEVTKNEIAFQIMEEFGPLIEELASRARENPEMSPEEFALKYPNRR